jgi:hypothetical protein
MGKRPRGTTPANLGHESGLHTVGGEPLPATKKGGLAVRVHQCKCRSIKMLCCAGRPPRHTAAPPVLARELLILPSLSIIPNPP